MSLKEIEIISSKSGTHRAIIGKALATIGGGFVPEVRYRGSSNDIEATTTCMNRLIAETGSEWNSEHRDPAGSAADDPGVAAQVVLPCGESGTTLRFLLPVVGALGIPAKFKLEGRLPERPLSPLYEELIAHGQSLEGKGTDTIISSGKLKPGEYVIPGNVSSQYISGLLMALPILNGDSRLIVTGKLESSPYIDITLKALRAYGITINIEDSRNKNAEADGDSTLKPGIIYNIPGNQIYSRSEDYQVEGDWSNAAFWLVAGAIGEDSVRVRGLDSLSPQGDKAIIEVLRNFGVRVDVETDGEGESVTVYPGPLKGIALDGSQFPDLIPIISLAAAAAEGETRIVNAGRLRDKESDRLMATADILRTLGAHVEEQKDGLAIVGGEPLHGGEVDSYNDHRIAMTAAIASIIAEGPVEIRDSKAVNKSYPDFYNIFRQNFRDNIITR